LDKIGPTFKKLTRWSSQTCGCEKRVKIAFCIGILISV